MPLVYNKTPHSASKDIQSILSSRIRQPNESFKIASVFYRFWDAKFPSINMLITLVNEVFFFLLPWINQCLIRTNYLLTTLQETMVNKSIHVWLYDRKKKKGHQISLTLPTTTRDRMKTRRATFANFIHQVDATILKQVKYGVRHIYLLTLYTKTL
jgi:hypothetical protein